MKKEAIVFRDWLDMYMKKNKSKLGSNFQGWGTGRILVLLLEKSHEAKLSGWSG